MFLSAPAVATKFPSVGQTSIQYVQAVRDKIFKINEKFKLKKEKKNEGELISSIADCFGDQSMS